jgi:type IV pilus assembly protein PilA
MNTNFKAKFLQNLVSKKKGNEGFTLIELLVVIIIVGVLAAIALPSFLNQIGKARGSEAKANLGTINRGQQAYRLERNTFSTVLGGLDAQVTGKFYTYTVGGANAATASALAGTSANGNELKPASALVNQAGDIFTQIICESTTTAAANASATAPTATTLPTPAAPQGGCAGGYLAVQ